MKKKTEESNYNNYKNKINLIELFTNEEIKSLKKLMPDINNIINISSNKTNFFNNTSGKTDKSCKRQASQRKIKNRIQFNQNFAYIDKEKFYKIFLEKVKTYFEKEENSIISKILSMLIKEIYYYSHLIKENIIYSEYFNNVKKKSIITEEIKKGKETKASVEKVKTRSKSEKLPKDKYPKINPPSKPEEVEQNDVRKSIGSSGCSNDMAKNKGIKEYKMKKQLSFEQEYSTINDSKNNGLKKWENSKIIDENSNVTYFINVLPSENDCNNTTNITNTSYNTSSLFISKSNKANPKRNVLQSNCYYSKININTGNDFTNSHENNKVKSDIRMYMNRRKQKAQNPGFKTILKYSAKTVNQAKNNYKNSNKENNKGITNKNEDRKSISFINIDSNILDNIETKDFNIFELDKNVGQEGTLPIIGYYIFNRFGFYNIINYNKFEKWCKKISEGYIRENYYHTDLHAADISHTCLIYFKLGDINEICKLNEISKCALFLSCICHDYKHPGLNNNYLKETNDELSIRYNDISILENMHISETFKLMKNVEYNIFENLEKNIYKQFRKEMIDCVLATDMAFHNGFIDFMKIEIKNNENDNNIIDKNENICKNDNHQKYMNLLIHSADISNPTKPFDIYFHWANLVINEFYSQGDKEKQLNLPCSCDREKVTIFQSQLGFINFIEIPFYSLFVDLFPKLHFFLETLNFNKAQLLKIQEQKLIENKEKVQKQK